MGLEFLMGFDEKPNLGQFSFHQALPSFFLSERFWLSLSLQEPSQTIRNYVNLSGLKKYFQQD
jgi:hypothetical protein